MRSLILLCVISACSGCDELLGLCGNVVVQTVKSPDGAHVAVLFTRDCGATTALSTQVSVLGSTKSLSGGGNAFVADDNHGAVRASSTGAIPMTLRWTAADHLSISYPAGARVFKKESRVDGVAITYAP
jgi:hypothetical protein